MTHTLRCLGLTGGLALSLVAWGAPPLGAQGLAPTWTQKTHKVPGPPAGPMGYAWLRIMYDPVDQRTVVVGGSGSTYGNDVHHYDVGVDQWTTLSAFIDCPGIQDFVPMTKRDELVAEYDPVNQLYWMFGGSGFGCGGRSGTAQSGSTPTHVVDPTLPAATDDAYKDWTVQVGSNKAYVAAYEPASRTLTLATPVAGLTTGSAYTLRPQRGGGTFYYSPRDRTWGSLDGPHWGYAGPSPITRLSPAFAYSSADQALLMFGGSFQRNDTWVIDLHTRQWVQMLPVGAPGAPVARAQIENAMVYDEDNDVFILFGGQCESTACGTFYGKLDETWAYSLKTNTWTRLEPIGRPPARDQMQLSYDRVHKKVVLYGGRGADGTARHDLWVFDYKANAWTELFPLVSPPATRLRSMVYDPDARVHVLYTVPYVWTLALDPAPPGNPVPGITSLAPAASTPGGPAFSLAVNGGNFIASSMVRWNGADRPTTFIGPAQLQAAISAEDIAAPGAAQVTVFNPEPGGGVSGPATFTIATQGKDLAIEGLAVSPATVAGGQSVTVSYRNVNRGTVKVTETYTDKIYLSTKNTLDGVTEVALGQSPGHTADLAPSATLASSQAVLIPGTTLTGSYFLLVQADALGAVVEIDEGNNVSAVPLAVTGLAAGEIRLDNAPTGVQDAAGGRTFTGTWCKSAATGSYGPDSLYSCGASLDTYRWTPTIPAAADYNVYVWWTAYSTRSKTVPISVYHAGGTATVTFNQQSGGGQWQLLGRYTLASGMSSYVEVSDPSGQAGADAVRFVPAP